MQCSLHKQKEGQLTREESTDFHCCGMIFFLDNIQSVPFEGLDSDLSFNSTSVCLDGADYV